MKEGKNMRSSYLDRLLTFIKDALTAFRGLPLWQIALMIILPDVLVVLYVVIIKKLNTGKVGVE